VPYNKGVVYLSIACVPRKSAVGYVSSVWRSLTSLFVLLTVPHHSFSFRDQAIVLVAEGRLSSSAVRGQSTSRAWLHKYLTDGQAGWRRGTGLWYPYSSAQAVELLAEVQRKPIGSEKEISSLGRNGRYCGS
jgi:hypothetical protein